MTDETNPDLPAAGHGTGFDAWLASLCGARGFRVVGRSRYDPDTTAVVESTTLRDTDLWHLGGVDPGGGRHICFREVVHVVSRVRHPHLLSVYDAGVHEDRAYLLMEHVAGRTLKERIRAQPLAVAEAVEASINLADAVEYLHQVGLEDLDLTTAGVVSSEGGTLKIDLRRMLDRRVLGGINSDGWFIWGGITGCEAPELMTGRYDRRGRDADVYALGAILFEMLTGRAALVRGAVGIEAVRRIIELDPERPRSLNPGVDRALESICLRCLAKAPARRYGSAASLAHELRRWRARAGRTGLIGRLWRGLRAGEWR